MQQHNCGRLLERGCRAPLTAACLHQTQSAPAEIYVQEDYISVGEAVPGLAEALALIFINTRFIVTLQCVFFSCLRRGRTSQKPALS